MHLSLYEAASRAKIFCYVAGLSPVESSGKTKYFWPAVTVDISVPWYTCARLNTGRQEET